MKVEHELFAHHYIITGNKDKAYKAAYPQAEGEALKTSARRLINEPDVRKFIHDSLAADRQQAILIHHVTEQERADEEYASLMLQRKILRGMIVGTHKVRKHIRVKDHIEVVEDDISPFAILQAIDKDAKLTNNWYARHNKMAIDKPEPTVKEKMIARDKGYTLPLPPIREGHSIPVHLQYRELANLGKEAFLEKHYGPDYEPALRALEIKEKPEMEAIYKKQGLRILDYCPTEEEMLDMQGVYAYNRKLQAEKKAQQLNEKGKPANPDGSVPFPELYFTPPDEEPLSIPAVFTAQTDITEEISQAGEATLAQENSPVEGGGATDEGDVPQNTNQELSLAEDGENSGLTNTNPILYIAPGVPYYHKGTPQAQAERKYLLSKGVNPRSFPPPDPPPPTPQQIADGLKQCLEDVRNDPNSIYQVCGNEIKLKEKNQEPPPSTDTN